MNILENDQANKNRLLKKALDILACFSIEKPWLGVNEISRKLDLYKSNVHDILKTLEAYGYVQQDPATSQYALGYSILTRSHVVSSTMTHYDCIVPHLRVCAEKTGEVAYYGILHDYKVMYLEQATVRDTQTYLYTRPMTGKTAPLYCTSIGKAMLAYTPESYIEKILELPRQSFTETTLCDRDALLADLALIRQRGYAIDNMEHEYGIKCVGVPIFDSRSKLVGAFSLVGPSMRYTDDAILQYAQILSEQCFELRSKL